MSPKRIVWGCWLLAVTEKFPIYSVNGMEKQGVLCIYGIWMLHDIGRIDGEDGWNSGVR